MKHDWEVLRLGGVLKLEYGKPLDPSDRSPQGEYPAYGANGVKARTNKYLVDEVSIIVGRKGSAGEVTLSEERFWPLDVTYYVEFDRSSHNVRFLYYLLRNLNLPSLAKGVKPGINRNSVYSLEVSVPPLAEQERIVRILDEALGHLNAVRIGASIASSLAANLPDSYVRQLLVSKGSSWPQRAVDDIAERCLGKMLDKSKNRGDLKPYLRNQNVRWFGFDLDDVLTMRFLPEERERYTARKGDVLVCEGGYPGRAAVWEGEDPVYFQKAVHRVRFEDPEMAEWFVNYLHFCDNDGLLRRHFTGTGIQHFTGKALGAFQVPTPPTRELGQIVEDMRDMRRASEELTLAHSSKIEACDALRASLLNEAFKGRL